MNSTTGKTTPTPILELIELVQPGSWTDPQVAVRRAKATKEYFYRTRPDVVREVVEALKCVEDNLITETGNRYVKAKFTEPEVALIKNALRLLNGTAQPGREE